MNLAYLDTFAIFEVPYLEFVGLELYKLYEGQLKTFNPNIETILFFLKNSLLFAF